MIQSSKNTAPERVLALLFSLCLLLTTIAVCILNTTPPTSRDALTHHLYVPKLWLQHGSFYEIRDITFSYYPMLLDLFYTIPLALGNDIIPKYIHFFFALFTAWLIFDYLRNRLNHIWGLIGSLFFLSLPIIVKLSITVYVDLGLIAFSTASLLMLFKWVDIKKLRYLLLAGIFCGLAASTKYNGLIIVFLLTLFTPLLFSRSTVGAKEHSSFRALGYGVFFLLISLLTFSPWMIKNYTWTGNPVYPLYNSIFQDLNSKSSKQTVTTQENGSNQKTSIAKQLTSRTSSVFAQRKVLYHETWWQALLLPIRFFFEGQDDDPRYFDGKLNPFLLFLPFFAFFFFRYPRQIKIEIYCLFAFAWLSFFFAFFQGSLRIRYIAPSLPAFIILATYGLHNISSRLQLNDNKNTNLRNIAMGGILIPLFLYNGLYIAHQFNTIKPLSYITGKISRDAFIAQFLPEYPIQQYANKHLKTGDKILAIYLGNRGYYFDFPVRFDLTDNSHLFADAILSSQTGDEISKKLKGQGLTHLFIRLDLFTQKANENLSREKIHLVNTFLTENTKQLAANKRYGLFELRESTPLTQ
jgi:4-amino-4-deoxy-L-arabinose transferase-like glycosyltransferase